MSLRRYLAVTTLFIVPSVIVEFLSGNTTFAVFRDPPSLALMIVEYGSGAVVARELAKIWQKGFASILLLGAVYGMFNEGVGTGGFFDPNFYSVVEWGLKDYGRWGGINVIWALRITVFHAIFSITVPIIIVEALYPDFADRRLLSGHKSLIGFFILLVFTTGLQRAILTYLQPPINPFVFISMLGLMLLLTLTARLFPAFGGIATRRAPSDVTLIILAVVGSFTWILVIPGILSLIHRPIVDIVTLVCFLFLVSRMLLGLTDLSSRQRLALAAGAEAPLLAHAVFSALFVPAAITFALLVAAWRSTGEEIRRRTAVFPVLLCGGATGVGAALAASLLQRVLA